MKNIIMVLVGLALLLGAIVVTAAEKNPTAPRDSTEAVTTEPEATQQTDQVIVYYLHMNRRCMTCEKLETYSKEAVETGFTEQLKDSSIVGGIPFLVEN